MLHQGKPRHGKSFIPVRNPLAGIPQKALCSHLSFSSTLPRLSLFIKALCIIISSYSMFSPDAAKITMMMVTFLIIAATIY